MEKWADVVYGWPLSKCPKHEEDCANFCVLLRTRSLFYYSALTTYKESAQVNRIQWTPCLRKSELYPKENIVFCE